MQQRQNLQGQRNHKIVIENNQFCPNHLKIEKGQVVEWSVSSKDSIEQNANSLYYFANRSHVISFDNLNAESQMLSKSGGTFVVKFLETGVYTYRCQIYTRMRGTVEVVEKISNYNQQDT